VLPGDFNVVPTHAEFRRILDQGWIDAIRTIYPNAPMYTFCETAGNAMPAFASIIYC
jgi:exonuclease III